MACGDSSPQYCPSGGTAVYSGTVGTMSGNFLLVDSAGITPNAVLAVIGLIPLTGEWVYDEGGYIRLSITLGGFSYYLEFHPDSCSDTGVVNCSGTATNAVNVHYDMLLSRIL